MLRPARISRWSQQLSCEPTVASVFAVRAIVPSIGADGASRPHIAARNRRRHRRAASGRQRDGRAKHTRGEPPTASISRPALRWGSCVGLGTIRRSSRSQSRKGTSGG